MIGGGSNLKCLHIYVMPMYIFMHYRVYGPPLHLPTATPHQLLKVKCKASRTNINATRSIFTYSLIKEGLFTQREVSRRHVQLTARVKFPRLAAKLGSKVAIYSTLLKDIHGYLSPSKECMMLCSSRTATKRDFPRGKKKKEWRYRVDSAIIDRVI